MESIPPRPANEKVKARTSVPELVGIIVLAILATVMTLIIIFVIRPKLFSGETAVVPGIPTTVTCPTSDPPVNLTSVVNDVSVASFQASWDPVLIPNTTGKTILGYNVYVNSTPGVTLANSGNATFTATTTVKILKYKSGSLAFGQTYYWRVQTVDECGPGDLSTEEQIIAI